MRLLRSRFGGLYVFGAVFLVTSLCLRAALCVHSLANLDCTPWVLCKTFCIGMLYDVVMYFYLVIPVAIFFLFASDRVYRTRITRWLLAGLYFVGLFAMLFDVVGEWLFWQEFGARYNFVSVDYISYTHEFAGVLVESFPVSIILGFVLLVAAVVFLATRKLLLATFESISSFRQRLWPGLVYVLAPVLAIIFVNPSLAEITRNHYNNELTKNGMYSFLAAVKYNIISYEKDYITEDESTAFRRLRERLGAEGARFTGDDLRDVTREVTGRGPEKRCNVVIVIVESLSGRFLGEFGNREGLTPNLDRLSHECLFFRNLYATGTRTDRGLEAMILSVPPTPGRCVVKKPIYDNPFSLGGIFRERGYDTKFLYPGEATFDNMKAFFQHNGFSVVDVTRFSRREVTWANIWGACDEDLFRKALKECDASSDAGKPFCSVVLTASNHQPFTYPGMDPVTGRCRAGTVRYTDRAIGQFLSEARSKPWFDNTIFVIVADHCADTAGRAEMTVAGYHIPAFIYAPKLVPPRQVESVASQMDLTPTVLGLLNFNYKSRFFGRDLLGPGESRAFMGSYQDLGFLRDGKFVILQPEHRSSFWQISPDGAQTESCADPRLLYDAVCSYQTAAAFLRRQIEVPEPGLFDRW